MNHKCCFCIWCGGGAEVEVVKLFVVWVCKQKRTFCGFCVFFFFCTTSNGLELLHVVVIIIFLRLLFVFTLRLHLCFVYFCFCSALSVQTASKPLWAAVMFVYLWLYTFICLYTYSNLPGVSFMCKRLFICLYIQAVVVLESVNEYNARFTWNFAKRESLI